MMRKFLFIGSIAVLGTLGLGACNHSNQGNTTADNQATRPSSTAVDDAVKECRAKHPNAAAPASAQTAAPAAGQTAAHAPASGQSAAPPSTAAAADDTSGEDPCDRATIAAATWQPYLQQVVIANMGDVTNNPYFYFVPSSKYPDNQGAISRTQDQLNSVVQATVLPGNMVAAGGPDSATTAQLLESAFKQASPGSFKGVDVLFIGDKADEAAVKSAVGPSGATFKFVQM
ncbi:MAG TPA: hypothetical protein VJ862_08865 [Rhodanobacteraceae bacterium]|nr:hypothetical protein [Rhodanobacteraceae bacterium]